MEVGRGLDGLQEDADEESQADGGQGNVVQLEIVHEIEGDEDLREEAA